MRKRNSYSRIIHDLREWEKLSKGPKIQLFHHCVENDITSFIVDCSKMSSYTSNLGTALSESGLSRDRIQLIAALDAEQTTEEEIIYQVEDLLRILKTDYLDLLFIDANYPSEDLSAAVNRLKSQGKIVETGIKNLQEPEKSNFSKQFSVDAVLSSFKFTSAGAKTLTLEESASEEAIEMLFLECIDGKNSEELEKMATKYEFSQKELLLTWLLQHPAHFHPIIQGKSEADIDSAKKALQKRLIDEDWKKIPGKIIT